MPSFAKVNTANDNPLAGLWKDLSVASPVEDLLKESRTRAADILRTTIPGKLAHLKTLIAQESDPTSLLWTGHLEEGDYIAPRLVQPDAFPHLVSNGLGKRGLDSADLRIGERVVLPDEVARGSRTGQSTPSSEISEDTLVESGDKFAMSKFGSESQVEKGVQVGPHWFEVVPRNKVQADLILLMTKEHEDLHVLMTELRLWLELEIPLIEDGNSFGAEVQNHLIREVDLAHKKSNSFHNGLRQHHTDRIKLASDWVRYPNVLDYPAAIANSDRLDHFLARSYLRQLLTIYAGIMTKFQRNWEKVINPKGNGAAATGGMY